MIGRIWRECDWLLKAAVVGNVLAIALALYWAFFVFVLSR